MPRVAGAAAMTVLITGAFAAPSFAAPSFAAPSFAAPSFAAPSFADAGRGPSGPPARQTVRAALLTPTEAAAAVGYSGRPYESYDVAPTCVNVPTGFLCGRSFDTKDTNSPFPALVTVHVVGSPADAEAQMREVIRNSAAYGPRTTIVSSSRHTLVEVTRGFVAGGLDNVPVLSADVTRVFGSTLVGGSCQQRKSMASQAELIACANKLERAQERALAP